MTRVQDTMSRKKLAAFAMIVLCPLISVRAQNYMNHLRQDKTGKGSVTVTQSKAIDDLVDGKGLSPVGSAAKKPDVRTNETKKSRTDALTAGKTFAELTNAHSVAAKAEAARKEAETRMRETEKNERNETEIEAPVADMRKKVMRRSRKVPGYRVQAFAGGNTRNDKQRAQQVGNAIKMRYPEQPVYVHFYSPRWICRVGNFRAYQEAQQFLKQVKAMGYGAATIVKGQITVQY